MRSKEQEREREREREVQERVCECNPPSLEGVTETFVRTRLSCT